MSDLYSDTRTEEHCQALAEDDYSSVIYNLFEDIRCLKQRVEELENRERMLIMHCAALGVAYMDSDMSDLANDSWRSLHPDLQELINEKTKEYQPPEGGNGI